MNCYLLLTSGKNPRPSPHQNKSDYSRTKKNKARGLRHRHRFRRELAPYFSSCISHRVDVQIGQIILYSIYKRRFSLSQTALCADESGVVRPCIGKEKDGG